MMTSAVTFTALGLAAVSYVDAFQTPLPLLAKPFAAAMGSMSTTSATSSLLAGGAFSSLLTSEMDMDAAALLDDAGGGLGGAFDAVRNIAAGITVIVFLLAGLTFLYASFIIPAAAQELEKECRELDPQLWDQYVARLGEGETMGQRPDLMQELGVKLQPLLEEKLRAMDAAGLPTPLETTMNPFSSAGGSKRDTDVSSPTIPTSSGSQWENNDDIIDAVVVKTTDDDSKVSDDKS
jgi:hypothetical protein